MTISVSLENTIILFSSDHGGLSTSKGSPTSNLPLRAGKGWVFEGGLRVPTIIYWPGVTEPGSVSDVPNIGQDFFPTMLEMAGLPPRPDDHINGLSLVPVLKGTGDLDRDALFWHYPQYGNQGGSPNSAILEGIQPRIQITTSKSDGATPLLVRLNRERQLVSHGFIRLKPAIRLAPPPMNV